MKRQEAIALACAFAEREGFDTTQYVVTARRNKEEWRVHFRGKVAKPGNFLAIYVNDELQEVTRLVPGK